MADDEPPRLGELKAGSFCTLTNGKRVKILTVNHRWAVCQDLKLGGGIKESIVIVPASEIALDVFHERGPLAMRFKK